MDFFTLNGLTKENAVKQRMTTKDRVQKNGKSAIWVIDRILTCCNGITEEQFRKDCVIHDGVTRNIQLLGQVMSQFPEETWIGVREAFYKMQYGCIVLRDALFMNVDLGLLWNTVTRELPEYRKMLEQALEAMR